MLAVARSDGLEIYDSALNLVQIIYEITVPSVDWHPDGMHLALARGRGVEIWIRDNNDQLIFSERLEMSDVALGVFWNVDGSRLAAFNGAGTRPNPDSERLFPGHYATVIIWETENWQVITETVERYAIPDFQGIYRLDWHPNDPYTFVVAGAQTSIDGNGNCVFTSYLAFITNSETGTVEYIIEDVARTQIYGVTWCPDGSCIIVGDEPVAGILSIPSGEPMGGYAVFNALNLQWRSDGAYLYAGGGLFAADNPDSLEWFFGISTWHPTLANTITSSIDNVPVNNDLTDVPGYIPLNIPPTADAGADPHRRRERIRYGHARWLGQLRSDVRSAIHTFLSCRMESHQ